MKEKINKLGLSIHQVYITSILCLFGLLSMIYVALTSGELFSYFYCIATVVFVALPLIMSGIFRWRMNWLFYLLFTFYTLGPLLGAVYNFYYYTSWWDDLLHLLAGTIFAVVGAELAGVLNKGNKTSYVFAAIFGVLISISIAVVWEIFEYSCDVFLGSDMQADTIVNMINTKINRTDGIVDSYNGITETIVNGQSLGINGYLDIGLIDTMHDMIIETVGALVFLVYALVDKNNHPLIVELKNGDA
jgi:uncharacterized membrane protein YjdF